MQHELFNLGSILATLPEDVHPKQARVTEAEVARLEAEMDGMNRDLPPLRSFVLPGGSRLNAELHVCRTVCRRAERDAVALARAESVPPEAVRYLNRLGDALFVWSRWASHATGAPETLWEPNQSSLGAGWWIIEDKEKSMQKNTARPLAVGLMVLGLWRGWRRTLNFAPVGALSLFAGAPPAGMAGYAAAAGADGGDRSVSWAAIPSPRRSFTPAF